MLRRPLATETHEDFSEPILPGKGASDYERYLRTDELLALQKSPDEQVHPDELPVPDGAPVLGAVAQARYLRGRAGDRAPPCG